MSTQSTPASNSTPTGRAIAAAEQLTTVINEMAFDSGAFAEVLASQHRTLQQSTTAVFLTTILRIAENGTDARNEAAVLACRRIHEFLKSDPEFYIGNGNVVRFPFV
jgi:hypothetical protein